MTLLDIAGEHRTKPAPPHPHYLVANVYSALEQYALELA